jgi:hypothetical protein
LEEAVKIRINSVEEGTPWEQDGPRIASVGKRILKDKCLMGKFLDYKNKSQEMRENSERG